MHTLLLASILWAAPAAAQDPATVLPPAQPGATSCNQPTADPVIHITVPGGPFLALPSHDGCWIFVSLVRTSETPARIAVLRRANGALSLARELTIPTNATGMALTRDGCPGEAPARGHPRRGRGPRHQPAGDVRRLDSARRVRPGQAGDVAGR